MHTLNFSDISDLGVEVCTVGVKFGKDTFLLLSVSVLFRGLPPLACLQGCRTLLRRVSSTGLDSWAFRESSLESDLESSLEFSLESIVEQPEGWRKRS